MGVQRERFIRLCAVAGIAAVLGLTACSTAVETTSAQPDSSTAGVSSVNQESSNAIEPTSEPSFQSSSSADSAPSNNSIPSASSSASSKGKSPKAAAAASGNEASSAKSDGAASTDKAGDQASTEVESTRADGFDANIVSTSKSSATSKAKTGSKQVTSTSKSKSAASAAGKQKNGSAQKSNQKAADKAASKSEEKPQRKWVEPVYKTVEHPEVGHNEQVVVGERYFCLCGEEVGSPEGWKQHRADFIASNGGKCNGQHVSYTKEDIVEERYVVDSPAWTEKVLVSEGHWE